MKIYQIELTNICNLKCSFCPNRYRWSHRPHGYFDISLLHTLDFGDTKYLELQLSGESMLHPKIDEAVSIIKSKGVLVGISSNGTIPGNYDQFDIVTTTKDSERDFKLFGPNTYFQTLGEDYAYEDYSHETQFGAPKGCLTPFEYVSIQWDGSVVPCCKCHGQQHVFGNIKNAPLSEIFNGEQANQFRRNMDRNYICQYCTSPNPHLIHSKLLQWLKDK